MFNLLYLKITTSHFTIKKKTVVRVIAINESRNICIIIKYKHFTLELHGLQSRFLCKHFLVVLRNSLSSMLVILLKKEGERKKKKIILTCSIKVVNLVTSWQFHSERVMLNIPTFEF